MNADELKKADEIVRALRKAQEDYKNDIVSTGRIRIDAMARDCADIIESLQAQLKRKEGAIQEWIDGVCISQKHLSQIGKLQAQLSASQRRAQDARNELCQKCGRYRDAHKGACDGCRWKEEHNETD